MPDSKYPDFVFCMLVSYTAGVQFKGSVVAWVLKFEFIWWVSFWMSGQLTDFRKYLISYFIGILGGVLLDPLVNPH